MFMEHGSSSVPQESILTSNRFLERKMSYLFTTCSFVLTGRKYSNEEGKLDFASD